MRIMINICHSAAQPAKNLTAICNLNSELKKKKMHGQTALCIDSEEEEEEPRSQMQGNWDFWSAQLLCKNLRI